MGMREFLEKKSFGGQIGYCKDAVLVDDLFDFLWEDNAIGFAKAYSIYLNDYWDKEIKNNFIGIGDGDKRKKDFLRCVAIDEDRVKELIKELK